MGLPLMLTVLLASVVKQRKQSLEKMSGISSAQETESIQTEPVRTGQLFPVIGKRPVQTKPFTAVRVT